jgi:serine/threonine protein kinase
MATTLGQLWALQNPPSPIPPWWKPESRSPALDGFDLVYSEGEIPDWIIDKRLYTHPQNHIRVESARLLNESKQEVAIKEFDTPDDHNTRRLMAEEINTVRRLHHIHVVRIAGSYEIPGRIGFFMLPRADNDLHDLLSLPFTKTPQPLRLQALQRAWGMPLTDYLATTIGCLANALMYLHSKEKPENHLQGEDKLVKHKDIKPHNILIDGDRIVLADFGISRVVSEGNTTTQGPTSTTNRVKFTSDDICHFIFCI